MRALIGIMALLLLVVAGNSQAGDKKEKRKGTTIGVLVSKEPNAILVKADGEEEPRKYVPRWIGGLPSNGGGLDKDMLKTFANLKVGSRVEVEWFFEERPRAVSVKVLEEAKDKD